MKLRIAERKKRKPDIKEKARRFAIILGSEAMMCNTVSHLSEPA